MHQRIQNRQRWMIAIIAVLILAAAAGCGFLPGANQTGGEETPAEKPSGVLPTETAAAPTATENGEPAGEVTEAEPIEEASPPPLEAKPTARVGLQGTDPGTVTLASGDIQLVEFFAFW